MPVIKTDYRRWIEVMDMLIEDDRYEEDRGFLTMIKSCVAHNEEITDRQIRAIQEMQKKRGDL
ncbi:hypothetical protein [Fodinibius sp. SL11]|uniref:hypothetical protein n=1 Tax=Fodinibius sp. SL11 TaxID=3425690 RepID=UPI003F8815D9